ncbi:MAG: hypothetical protein IJ523_11775 [Succinivibrionaceae bacterium]|nr:hypothetical protein [Succinivibrionaceae bacterium]
MYKIYLKEQDQLKDTDFPIIAHLNEAANSDFILFLQNLNNGTGSGYEFTCSNFWDDLDEYDQSQIKQFEGVEISTQADEEVVFSYDELLYYIKLIRQRIITNKQNEVIIDKLISDFSKKYTNK